MVFFINSNGIFKYLFGGPYRFDTALKPDQFIGKHFREILPQDFHVLLLVLLLNLFYPVLRNWFGI